MAKRNKQKKKQVKPVRQEKTERSATVLEIVSTTIAAFALFVSIIALRYSTHYAQLEYEYKVDPQMEIHGNMEVMVNPSIGEDPLAAMSEIQVSILEKNNLDRAYVVYTDNRVEALDLGTMEGTLAGKIKSGLDSAPDIVSEEWEYRYFFLYMESLDGDNNLHLIYTKSSPGILEFNVVSGIEVYGLAKAEYKNEEDYAGEKLMAQKYVQLLKELPEYMGQQAF